MKEQIRRILELPGNIGLTVAGNQGVKVRQFVALFETLIKDATARDRVSLERCNRINAEAMRERDDLLMPSHALMKASLISLELDEQKANYGLLKAKRAETRQIAIKHKERANLHAEHISRLLAQLQEQFDRGTGLLQEVGELKASLSAVRDERDVLLQKLQKPQPVEGSPITPQEIREQLDELDAQIAKHEVNLGGVPSEADAKAAKIEADRKYYADAKAQFAADKAAKEPARNNEAAAKVQDPPDDGAAHGRLETLDAFQAIVGVPHKWVIFTEVGSVTERQWMSGGYITTSTLRIPHVCSACKGSGLAPYLGDSHSTCNACKGGGVLWENREIVKKPRTRKARR